MTNTLSGGGRPEVEIGRMIEEPGAFGVDWAAFSQRLITRDLLSDLLSPARPVPESPGATRADVAELARSRPQGE